MDIKNSTPASSASASIESPLLNKLPGELRNKIYRLALVSDQPVLAGAKFPALTRTCRTIRQEALSSIFLSENTFDLYPQDFRDNRTLESWIDAIGIEKAKKIRRVRVYHFVATIKSEYTCWMPWVTEFSLPLNDDKDTKVRFTSSNRHNPEHVRPQGKESPGQSRRCTCSATEVIERRLYGSLERLEHLLDTVRAFRALLQIGEDMELRDAMSSMCKICGKRAWLFTNAVGWDRGKWEEATDDGDGFIFDDNFMV